MFPNLKLGEDKYLSVHIPNGDNLAADCSVLTDSISGCEGPATPLIRPGAKKHKNDDSVNKTVSYYDIPQLQKVRTKIGRSLAS